MKNIELIRTNKIHFIKFAKGILPPIVWQSLYKLLVVRNIDQGDLYKPFYSPWLENDFISEFKAIKPYTLCSQESCWVLSNMLKHALNVEGDIFEAGVFQGGTALLLKNILLNHGERHLYLFDSFEGMKKVDIQKDRHQKGDFQDVSLEMVQSVVGLYDFISYRKGWIPETFKGLEENIFCFAHIDLDLHDSILNCCTYIYPRISKGGVMISDDYGYPSCPGARHAIDQFFCDKPERPLVLQTGQALVHKL